MKRIIVALALAFGLALVIAPPASATQTQCTASNDGAVHYCINFSKDAGSDGFYVYWVKGYCDPFAYGTEPIAGWDDIAIDGHGMLLMNLDTLHTQWSVSDANSNVHLDSGGDHACTRTWWIQEHYPAMNHLYVEWDGTEQLNHQSDIDFHLHMDFING